MSLEQQLLVIGLMPPGFGRVDPYVIIESSDEALDYPYRLLVNDTGSVETLVLADDN